MKMFLLELPSLCLSQTLREQALHQTMSSQAAKDQLQGLGSAFLDGFKLAVKAGRTALSNPTVVAVHKQSFGRLVLLSIGVYTSIFMATLPLHFMLRMLHLVGKDTADYRTWLSQFATAAFFYLPVVLAFLVRWVFYRPLERAYFAVLKVGVQDADQANIPHRTPGVPVPPSREKVS